MNLCRLLNWVCIWCASFGMSNAATPLPPNTGMTLVADVAGTTLANDAYWADKCKIIPPTALFIVVQMGNVTDFFKPINSETSFCEMLQSHNKYRWSPDVLHWFDVEFHGSGASYGGSILWWPRDKGGAEDNRAYLSFWGDTGNMGGCCSSSTEVSKTYQIAGNAESTEWMQSFKMLYGFSFEEFARLFAENRQLNTTVMTLSNNLIAQQDIVADVFDNITAEQGKIFTLSKNLTAEQNKVALLTKSLTTEQGKHNALSQNLTTCNAKLEQRRLSRLAQAEEDLANDQVTTGGTNSDTDGNSMTSSKGGVAGGVVAGLVVVGIAVFMLWRNSVQRTQRNNAEAEELRDRGATLEMMQNPMWGQQRGAAVEGGPAANLEDVADVYYSEIAEVPNQDADGYVVDDSLAEPETPVYATYASSGAPGGAFYAAPTDGDGVATYAAPLDTATTAPQPSASPPEVGGVTYSRSANSVVVPGSNTSHA